MSVYVIADIGACHDGNRGAMDLAIREALAVGVNALKFQWTSDPRRMAHRRGRAEQDGYAAIYDRYLKWPESWHRELAEECRSAGIDYMCTVFLPDDVAVVAPYVSRFKVASFEALDDAFIRAHVGFEKPILVSTGMLTDGQAHALQRGHTYPLTLLHCVSAYPTPVAELNLGVFRPRDYGEQYDADVFCLYDGFSDHSDPTFTWTGALAVAAGAQVVEAHLRLDGTDPANPDFAHAMAPRQFADYVRHIRFAETCLGDGEKRLMPCEAAMAQYRVAGLTR